MSLSTSRPAEPARSRGNGARTAPGLPGETNGTLARSNIVLSDAGDYDVVVANAIGSATSQVATLTVTLRRSRQI